LKNILLNILKYTKTTVQKLNIDLPGLAKIDKNHIQQVQHGQDQNQAMIFEYTQSIHYLFFDQQYEVLCLILQDKT
jgi:hypothetical protein